MYYCNICLTFLSSKHSERSYREVFHIFEDQAVPILITDNRVVVLKSVDDLPFYLAVQLFERLRMDEGNVAEGKTGFGVC